MQWLAEICVKRPVFASVLSLVIFVIGGVFYTKLGVDQFPKVDFPAVVVITRLPGASPEDVEREITDKVEAAINTISAIDELRSDSSEGVSKVFVTFLLEKDVDVATQEVRDRVASVIADLPKDIEQPVISKIDPDASPVLYLSLRAPGRTQKEVTDYADRVVRRRIESTAGVGMVRIIGGERRQINVWVDPVKLRALGLGAPAVASAIDAQNLTLPGGRVDVSRDFLTLRVHGRVESVDELRKIVVQEQNGRSVRLSEVADVEDGTEEVETAASWSGERTVLLTVRKQSGTNTITVVDKVLARMADLQRELPSGYKLEVQRDASQAIRTGTEAVSSHLVLGALFAALVVLLFLGNVRSTVIAAIAIPTSIVGTFALMYSRGYTLNTITLLALALAVGIVIDDAIVVLENIYRYVDEKGYEPKEAAVAATKEIGMAVTATTLSLIAVFLPIAFIAGIPGRFLSSFGFTMAFSIAVSLFVSFTMTPMLASQWLKKKRAGETRKTILERMVDVGYRPIERGYGRLLAFLMRRRWIVVVASAVALFAMVPLAAKAKKGFLPVDDRAQFEVLVRLPEGRSVAATEVIGERVARQLRAMPEVVATLTTIGDDDARTPNQARIYVKLSDPARRKRNQDQIKDVVRNQVLSTLPKDLRTAIADVSEFGGGQSTARIQYILAGNDLERLTQANDHVLKRIREIPGAVDVDSSMVVGKPELGVFIDRDRAADLGVQVADIARALQLYVGGQKVSTYAENGEEYDVRLRATSEYRTDEDRLQLLTVPSRKLGLVPLSDVVKLRAGSGPATINRYNRERQVTFMVNAAPGFSEGKIGEQVVKAIEAEKLPRTFAIKPTGQAKLMKETGISFVLGLLASMVFMYLILAAQFESWLHPITILLSLPLTLPFAILSVILFGLALDIYSFLGIFVLFGVVKKNAILQIDHTNKLRAHGMPRLEAILRANKDRLRPILMTTFAFVAGMIPLVTSKGIGAGFNRATAGVVVGGQVLSLLLTLVAVPVAYSLFDDASSWLKRKVLRRGRGETAPVEFSAGEVTPVEVVE
jgi:hydrophobic/amphiphilic exporter-1 (mainly G- bacteria), HAE1 family